MKHGSFVWVGHSTGNRLEYSRMKWKKNVYGKNNFLKSLLSFRLLVFLITSPLLSRLGHGFSWRWAFIMVWSEMKGTPNINMALLLAYSDLSLGSEREKSQVKINEFFYLNILWILLLCTKICFCSEVAQPHLDCGSDLAMMARLGRGKQPATFLFLGNILA